MNIISCDVGWKEKTKRNAVTIVTESGQVNFLQSGLDDDHLVALVREWAEPKAQILPLPSLTKRRSNTQNAPKSAKDNHANL